MNLIDTTTLMPLSVDELRARFPHVSFPVNLVGVDLTEYGVGELVYTPAPAVTEYQTLTQGPLSGEGNVYTTTWIVGLLPIEECQQILLNKVAAYRAGYAYANTRFNGVSIPIDTQVISILTVVSTGTTTIDFKGDDGWLVLSPADATGLLAQIQDQVQSAFTNEKKHHDAIMVLTESQDVIDYDYTTGW